MKNWPKLSETIEYPRYPGHCQGCGRDSSGVEGFITTWIECDDHDHPTEVIVLLCPSCELRLIDPHPRLYARDDTNKPRPGAMPHLCSQCELRTDLRCRHPALKANGGTGMHIRVGQPMRGFWDGRDPKTGKRTGGMMERWPKASQCEGQKIPENIR